MSTKNVTPVAEWAKHGYFDNLEQIKGAFKLAYQQGLDGMGESTARWMGLTDSQFYKWMHEVEFWDNFSNPHIESGVFEHADG
ncbi:MAG: hypothetical protein ACFB14_00200 [Leptolyngbyaceae cyanobacterium]|mgnify:CR=1 FL=1